MWTAPRSSVTGRSTVTVVATVCCWVPVNPRASTQPPVAGSAAIAFAILASRVGAREDMRKHARTATMRHGGADFRQLLVEYPISFDDFAVRIKGKTVNHKLPDVGNRDPNFVQGQRQRRLCGRLRDE
jgi:hypothetical protein